MQIEASEAKKFADRMLTEKAMVEKEKKQALATLHNMKSQLEEATRNQSDVEKSKCKLVDTISKLKQQLEEKEVLNSQLHQLKISLQTQVYNAEKSADDEAKVR